MIVAGKPRASKPVMRAVNATDAATQTSAIVVRAPSAHCASAIVPPGRG
jgi:hypothetical protein